MHLEVHVFGADQGESILIKFPNNEWGVVDCYACSKDISSNQALNYLFSQQVKRLHFVCLTHPHHDHYSGLMQILKHLPTRQFWYPAVMTSDLLRAIVKLEAQTMKASGNLQYSGKLIDLWEKINDLHANSRIEIRRLSLGTDMAAQNDLGGVQIVALAPSGDEAYRFERNLKNCFDSNGTLLPSKRQMSINQCSAALTISYAGQRIVLGGDVERQGWIDLLAQQAQLAEGACLVKVAHHGSQTGTCPKLWSTHAANTSHRIAVLTPFWKHRLPEKRVMAEIIATGYELYSTSEIARPAKLHSPTQAMAKLVSGSVPIATRGGMVSIEIGSQGKLVTSLQGQVHKL